MMEKIAFRVDASIEIGTGHVMRCLVLADVLRGGNVQCIFICRPHIGNLISVIKQRGYQVFALPALKDVTRVPNSHTAPNSWLGTDWVTDADETQHLLTSIGYEFVDWLLVDHYALDHRWEGAMRPIVHRIMVIDDLADRPHDCDLLLDQNLGRTEEDYARLLSTNTKRLIGPQYALLRTEFFAQRTQSLFRRAQNPQLKHLLISMGGVDLDNVTGQVLDAIKSSPLLEDLIITVVMGPHAPWLVQVQQQAEKMPQITFVHTNVRNMAKIMADTDLAIGGAGGTAWERCALGVASLIFVLSENQRAGALALQKRNAAILFDHVDDIGNWLISLADLKGIQTVLHQLSCAASEVTDGQGAIRVEQKMRAMNV
jgi:UDP-2,4-diacetamido-2,4,6-trideoxy-beta-L-altropyranose hydrolase